MHMEDPRILKSDIMPFFTTEFEGDWLWFPESSSLVVHGHAGWETKEAEAPQKEMLTSTFKFSF